MRRLAAVLLLMSSSASAQVLTGNQWLARYQGAEALDRIYSFAYVGGAIDGGGKFCAPQNVTVGQISEMTARLIINMVADRHLPAAWFVNAVGEATWPCKQQARREQL